MFNLERDVTLGIEEHFNRNRPTARGQRLSFEVCRYCQIIYGGSKGPSLTTVQINLRADIGGPPTLALANLAVVEYAKQKLKAQFDIDFEEVGDREEEKFYNLFIRIVDQDALDKLMTCLGNINTVIYIDETNAADLFRKVMMEILH